MPSATDPNEGFLEWLDEFNAHEDAEFRRWSAARRRARIATCLKHREAVDDGLWCSERAAVVLGPALGQRTNKKLPVPFHVPHVLSTSGLPDVAQRLFLTCLLMRPEQTAWRLDRGWFRQHQPLFLERRVYLTPRGDERTGRTLTETARHALDRATASLERAGLARRDGAWVWLVTLPPDPFAANYDDMYRSGLALDIPGNLLVEGWLHALPAPAMRMYLTARAVNAEQQWERRVHGSVPPTLQFPVGREHPKSTVNKYWPWLTHPGLVDGRPAQFTRGERWVLGKRSLRKFGRNCSRNWPSLSARRPATWMRGSSISRDGFRASGRLSVGRTTS